jgi:hypothetical protein
MFNPISRGFWAAIFQKLDITDTLLVVFTACLAVATFLLWQATCHLVNDARDTAERQLRAYVYVTFIDTELRQNPDGSSVFAVNPSMKVFGITPAGPGNTVGRFSAKVSNAA